MIVTTPRDTEPPPPSEGGAVPPQFVRETNRRLEQLEAQLSSVRGDIAEKVTAAVMKVLDQEIEHISVRLRRAVAETVSAQLEPQLGRSAAAVPTPPSPHP